MKANAPPVRRWLVIAGGVLALLVSAVLGVYAWAWSSTDESTIARAMIWRESDVGDQHRFPARRIPAGARVSPLRVGVEAELVSSEGKGLDESLRETDTLAFLVVHEDRLVHERYFDGATRESLQTSFSAAKSFVSTLVGIAIDEGVIESVEDPVTDYVPELAERDPRFKSITLRHLLTMSSGIRYEEGGFPRPFGDDTYTYYGVDLREVALDRVRIDGPPGLAWQYNNYHPLLLGLVLERATGMSVSDFMARRLWQPLGAEADATWNLDSERSGFEKLESGLNARPVDYARFGLLFLHDGEWNGRRIVSEDWVRAATGADPTTDSAYYHGYRYFWWLDVERPGRFYALGKYGQYIYVAPDADAVVVRLGRDWGVGNITWLATFREIADQLERP
jgi:CubicO group peptidase (beta-lactamase class C family)